MQKSRPDFNFALVIVQKTQLCHDEHATTPRPVEGALPGHLFATTLTRTCSACAR